MDYKLLKTSILLDESISVYNPSLVMKRCSEV